MIDFQSTRETTDPQTAACLRLLTAVVTLAIEDACKPLSKEEKKQFRNLNPDAKAAIRFLFYDDSFFPGYAKVIGISADHLRKALLDNDRKGYETRVVYRDVDQRILKARVRYEAHELESA